MQGSSLWRLRICDLELVLCIVPLFPPLFVTALMVCTSTAERRLSDAQRSRSGARRDALSRSVPCTAELGLLVIVCNQIG
jgi:hypothetical protein